VPSHEEVKGNEKAADKANAGARGEEDGVGAIAEKYKETSLVVIQRRISKAKWSETEQWWADKLSKKLSTE
jgi:hypothetical protein